MMNPFIQKALDDVHKFPTASATVTTPSSTTPEEKWALKRFSNGGLIVDDHFRVKLIPKAHSKSSSMSPGALDSMIYEATMQDVFALGDVR